MLDERHVYLIDDDESSLALMERFLTDAGARVTSSAGGEATLREIAVLSPDCVVTDLMMPGMDGVEVCRRLRGDPATAGVKLLVVSAKEFDADRRRAREAGADGYLAKPLDRQTFVETVDRLVEDRIALGYWGVRGTLPVPGPDTLRYGGNTSCLSLTLPDGRILIFDAGTGIRALGARLVDSAERIRGRIFISHPHWDHINALPFFTPLYAPGNEWEILGPTFDRGGIEDLLGGQMEPPYFPITMREFGASLSFRDLGEETLDVDGIEVRTLMLNHPGRCLGYRLTRGGTSICYVTDNEIPPADSPQRDPHYVDRLVRFVRGADLLVTDTTYRDEVYPSRVGWGHSRPREVVEVAHEAGVARLALWHHDPDDTDVQVEEKLEAALRLRDGLGSSVDVFAPAEGTTETL